jgi:hypothetical protein
LFAEFACTSATNELRSSRAEHLPIGTKFSQKRKDHDRSRLHKVCPHIYEDISNVGVLTTQLKQLQFHSPDEPEPTRIAGFCSQLEQNLFFWLKKARGSAAFP